MHELIATDSAIEPLVTSQSSVWCKGTDVLHLVVKLLCLYSIYIHNLYSTATVFIATHITFK